LFFDGCHHKHNNGIGKRNQGEELVYGQSMWKHAHREQDHNDGKNQANHGGNIAKDSWKLIGKHGTHKQDKNGNGKVKTQVFHFAQKFPGSVAGNFKQIPFTGCQQTDGYEDAEQTKI